jgi:hypothetical protein
VDDATHLVLPNQQFWVFFIGAFVPLAGYIINKVSPWNSETVKGIVQVVLTSIGGIAYTWVWGDVNGAADFIQQTVTAVISGLFAHQILWKPAGLNLVFGANPPGQQQLLPAPIASLRGISPTT